MGKLILIIFFLITVNNLFSDSLIDENKLNYMYQKDGYLKDITKKNSNLMYESVKRGVKVFQQQDANKPDSYNPNIKYPPPGSAKSMEEMERLNAEYQKYNKILDEYYYEVLDDFNFYQDKVNKAGSNADAALKQNFTAVEKLFELIIKSKEINNIVLKKDVINLSVEYKNYKKSNKDFTDLINRNYSEFVKKYKELQK